MALSWLARLRRRSPPPAEPEVSSPDPPAPFHAMTEGTRAQWSRILEADAAFSRDVAGRVLGHLTLLRDDTMASRSIDWSTRCRPPRGPTGPGSTRST